MFRSALLASSGSVMLASATIADITGGALVGYWTTANDFGGSSVTRFVQDVYIFSDDPTDALLNVYNWNASQTGITYFQSFTGTGWVPTNLRGPFDTAALQQADSFITIGGFDYSTGIPLQSPGAGAGVGVDPSFGGNDAAEPGQDAGWYNSSPPSLIGRPGDTVVGHAILIARFSHTAPFNLAGTTFECTWNNGLGTPGHQAMFSLSGFEDCNQNGLWDSWELESGVGWDYNNNQTLDDCEGYVVGVGEDYSTIASAIANVPDGGVILIPEPRTFEERVVIDRPIILAAPNGATISGTGNVGPGTVVVADNAPLGAAIIGLTITGGEEWTDFPRGSGLAASNSSIRVEDCKFENNRGSLGGGAVFEGGSPSLVGCEFVDNISADIGGGLRLIGGSVNVEDCTFRRNYANAGSGFAMAASDADLTMQGGWIRDHTGPPLQATLTSSSPSELVFITDLDIKNNIWTADSGAAIEINVSDPARCVLANNLICGNSGVPIDGLYTSAGGSILLPDRCPDWIVPDNASSINAAIVYSSSGSRIVVRPGDYFEPNLRIANIGVELMGGNDPSDARPTLRGPLILESTPPGTLIRGFEIRDGLGRASVPGHESYLVGGGLILLDAEGAIEDCVIRDNHARVGGGVFMQDGRISMQETTILENEAESHGGGVFVEGDGNTILELTACAVTTNHLPFATDVRAGGIDARGLIYAPQLRLEDCVITDNDLENIAQSPQGGGFDDLGGNLITLAFDCDLNGIEDLADIADLGIADCNSNLIPDHCEVADGSEADCDSNGILDSCDLDAGAVDLDLDGVPDICQDQLVFVVPTAFSTIPDAIAAAPNGSRIQLVPGTIHQSPIDLGSKNLEIIGDPSAPETVVIETPGQNATVLTIAGGQDHSTRIAGVTIKNGVGSAMEPGTGILVGGGVYVRNASPVIEDCIISTNRAARGGGLYLRNSDAIIRRSIIEGNIATDRGGGVVWLGGYFMVDDCQLSKNQSQEDGGGWYSETTGGLLRGGSVDGNLAGGSGGGIWMQGGALEAAIEFVDITENLAVDNGGGIHAMDGAVSIRGCSVESNDSTGLGGGIYWRGTELPLLIENSFVTNNQVVSRGAPGDADTRYGGGVYSYFEYRSPGIQVRFEDTDSGNICGNTPNDITGPYSIAEGAIDCQRPCADFNHDGEVNGSDIGVFLANMEMECSAVDCPWDINLDGELTYADIGLLLAMWGVCP